MTKLYYESSGLWVKNTWERRPTKQEWANRELLAAIPRIDILAARFDLYPDEGSALYPFHRVPDTSKGTYTGKEL